MCLHDFLSKVCSFGFYGVACNNSCGYCVNNSACDSSSGVCPEGCLAHWSGSKCNSHILLFCSKHSIHLVLHCL